MNTAAIVESAPVESAPKPWSDEPTSRADRRRVRAHIGGLHCSLCTGTIEKALGRKPGVHKVSVSLTHEQTLVEFDPGRTTADELMHTLTDIGYTLSDPRKVEPFEVQERALARERNHFLGALGLSWVGRWQSPGSAQYCAVGAAAPAVPGGRVS